MKAILDQIRLDTKRIVLKIGSSLFCPVPGKFDRSILAGLAEDCAALFEDGIRPVIVSSGAMAAGITRMNTDPFPASLPQKQAIAAIGQSQLMRAYEEALSVHNLIPAQVLVTQDNFENRRTYLNIRNTLEALLRLDRVVPVINENDTVAVEEITFGDNDILSAIIASKIDADALFLLTDVDGIFEVDPETGNRTDRLIEEITNLEDSELSTHAKESSNPLTRGGMVSKLQAARIATLAGVPVIIACGRKPRIVTEVLKKGGARTFIPAQRDSVSPRKRWIGSLPVRGTLTVDSGAESALVRNGRSLLPAGLTEVKGDFSVGDAVQVCGPDGRELAKGQCNYCAADIEKIRGHKTSEIESILGRKDYDEVIHRDNLVLLTSTAGSEAN